MKQRIVWLVKAFFLIFAICVFQKPLFMLCNFDLYSDASFVDWLKVMFHGRILDNSVSSYLLVIPSLVMILSVWVRMRKLVPFLRAYFAVVALLLSFVFVTDAVLYSYWGFKLDTTPFFYFFSSPKDAMASATTWQLILLPVSILIIAGLLYWFFSAVLLSRKSVDSIKLPVNPGVVTFVLLLLTAALFIPIRGGFTVSTMNVGKVFFSSSMPLNHAAINPVFSLLDSVTRSGDFDNRYHFMDDDEARALIEKWYREHTVERNDSAESLRPQLFKTERPDIVLVILESFSSKLMSTLGGEKGVAVNLDSIAKDGYLFTDFYANSFRTDRALVSILSGYPAQPTTSIMKYPAKTQSLPGIAKSLKKVGYRPKYFYGGDADFTNMRSYLMATGFEDIVCDEDFPITERLSKWGVHDHLVFERLFDDISSENESHTPFFKVIQTSSSHEPFEVPYHRLDNERLNAFAYTDSCVGNFVSRYKELPIWNNSVIIIMPDHLGCYPEDIDNLSVERYQIPLIITGGAVNGSGTIDTIGSQHDFATTLLSQLGLPTDEYSFGIDILDPQAPHFAFFTVPDAFGVVSADNTVIYDNQSSSTVVDEGFAPGANLEFGKAYLQTLYNDLSKR